MALIEEFREYGFTYNENEKNIIDGANTALINLDYPSLSDVRPKFVSNDPNKGKKVLINIESELLKCSEFAFSVAFVTLGGITPLLEAFSELEKRGVRGKILTTDYLSFSDPKALKKLDEFSNIEVRMFKTSDVVPNIGFHTKGYLFNRPDGTSHVIVGSSNLTQTALTQNKEWNVKMVSTEQGELVGDAISEFNDLWEMSLSLDSYIETYIQMYEEKQKIIAAQKVSTIESVKLEPNSMQIAFIERLNSLLEEGARRALLISATGERVIIVMGAVNVMKPRVSGTLNKYILCIA